MPRIFLTLALVSPMLIATACREATSIELEITTDVPCEEAKTVTTSIRVGTLTDYAERAPRAVTTHCDDATGRIGSLVILPDDDLRAEVAVKVVTASHNRLPDACEGQLSPDCIVATRVVGFVPYRSLTLPIHMQTSCAGLVCGPLETCDDGECRSARVDIARLIPDDDPPPDDAGVAEASALDVAVPPDPVPAVEAGTPPPTAPTAPSATVPTSPRDAGAIVPPPIDDDDDIAQPDGGKKKGGKDKEPKPKGKKKGSGKGNGADDRDR